MVGQGILAEVVVQGRSAAVKGSEIMALVQGNGSREQ
jgi:hypothetical protein